MGLSELTIEQWAGPPLGFNLARFRIIRRVGGPAVRAWVDAVDEVDGAKAWDDGRAR